MPPHLACGSCTPAGRHAPRDLPPPPATAILPPARLRRLQALVGPRQRPSVPQAALCDHRKPPLLGVFSRTNLGRGIVFSPILGPPDRIPPHRFNLGRCSSDGYDLLDCCHGLLLVKNTSRTEFVVCDPVTREQRRLAVPPEFKVCFFNGAVLCAASDQDHMHGACHSSPFKVVLMSMYEQEQHSQPLACVYSSETGIWGDRILAGAPCEISQKPAVQVGNCLYWLSVGDDILEFGLGEHSLTVITGPPVTGDILFRNRQIIQAEDGAVGYATLSYPRFQMWRRNIRGHGVATWVLWKTIDMRTVLRPPSHHEEMHAQLLGYDEDDVLLLSCDDGSVYLVQLKSMQSRKLSEMHSTGNRYFPFKSFLTPGMAIAHS